MFSLNFLNVNWIFFKNNYYRPQRSWAKVMFLQASMILSKGGVYLSACWDTPPEQTHREQTPPGADPPGSRHSPGADTPPGADTSLEADPLGADTQPPPPRTDPPLEQTYPPTRSRYTPPEQTPPLGADTPLEQTPPGKQTPTYGQRAAGTHPTGMHSCSKLQPLV